MTKTNKPDWKLFIDELNEGGLIPVIGPELLQVEIDGQKQYFRLWLARQLANELNLSSEGLEGELHPVQEVMLRHYRHNNPNSIKPYQFIKSLINREQWKTPDALLKLASIEKFNFFLTTIWEPFLERAIIDTRNLRDNQLCIMENNLAIRPDDIDKFTSRSARQQFDPAYIEKLYNDEAPPSVYYLLGRPSSLKTYALSEDDILEANLMFQSVTYRPDKLISYLSKRRLLMLGCNFPNWLTRFFISLTSPDPKNPSPQPVFVMSDSVCRHDQNLTDFLKRKDAFVVTDISVEGFIEQFYNHWEKTNYSGKSNEPTENPFTRGSIFISYASEDKKIAEILFNEIKNMDLPVWFDKRELKPGDEWSAKIHRNILESSVFIPLISSNSLARMKKPHGKEPPFFSQEWEYAEKLFSKSAGLPRIMPALIDDTSYDDDRIPSGIKKLHWLEAPDGIINDSSLAVLNTTFYDIQNQTN
jgi:hypothetical protein